MNENWQHLQWRRSRRCTSTSCVEVAEDGEGYLIRDSKDPKIAPLRFGREEWAAFLVGVRAGDFDF